MKLMLWLGTLLVTGCVYEHPGPSLPADDNTLPSTSSTVPAPPTKPPSSSTASTAAKPARPAIVMDRVTPTPTPPEVAPMPEPMLPSPAKTVSTPDRMPAPQLAGGGEAGQIIPEADTDSDASFDNLEIVDSSLKGKLAILRVGSEPTENNLLSVFAGLKNKTSHPLALEVQTLYKDRAGNPLSSGASWTPMTLKPHQETEYRSASLSSDAADFLVRIRSAQNTGNSGNQ